MARHAWRGSFAIPMTPFDDEDQIDEQVLADEISFCIESGVGGLVTPVMVSEFRVLSEDERRTMVRVPVQVSAGRVPVVANCAAVNTPLAVRYARYAEEAGAGEADPESVDSRHCLPRWPWWLALATLTRPEGVLFFLICLSVSMWRVRAPRGGGRQREVFPYLGWSLLLYAGLVVPHIIWRVAYYGEWLPNTFYAKTGGGLSQIPRGLAYLWESSLSCGGVLLMLPVILLWRGGAPRHFSAGVAALGDRCSQKREQGNDHHHRYPQLDRGKCPEDPSEH